ncbi:MAG: gamma-glutamyl-gamma-aminobutyrate hydrolase family protein [Candidatus Neomarinimicrobiota bacterium]
MSRAIPFIDILMMGRTLPPIREHFGDFDRWFQERPEVPARFRVHYLFDGDPPPKHSESDAWIITGSSGSVHDEFPWLPAVKEGIVRAANDGQPILGVCFGHQLLAIAIGGKVEINPKGWEMGPAVIDLTRAGTKAPLFQGMASRIPVYQTHREVVTSLPPGAQVLAINEMGLQAFQFGHQAFGVQFHPEFTAEIARMYVALRLDRDPDATFQSPGGSGDNSRKVLTNFIRHVTA